VTSFNYYAKKSIDKEDILTNKHYGWWKCGFSTRSTIHFIVTWQHPKRFRVWIGELASSMESFLAHPITFGKLSSLGPPFFLCTRG